MPKRKALLAWLLLALASPVVTPLAAEQEGCALCHLDGSRIDELTEDLIAERQVVPVSDLQQGDGYTIKKAPFDLYENILVKEAFLQTAHGKIACSRCHKGDPKADTPALAHQGLVKDPTVNGALEVCGECHQEITRTASRSLHMATDLSLAPLQARCSAEQWQGLQKEAVSQQCASCHEASCGSCHVSRPRLNGGGLVAGHVFQKKPDYLYQCAACHARPVVDDFTGKVSLGDVHYLKGKVCTDCHGAKEIHAEAVKAGGRFAPSPGRARCLDCHAEALAASQSCGNERHKGRVDCAVCHAQAYENCTSCHMGVDQDGVVYSQSGKSDKGFKIGLNPNQEEGQPRFVLVRQIPVKGDSFKAYGVDGLKNFQAQPTFKRSAVHNIQRQTWQNAHCNHCHGQNNLFLGTADVPEAERQANQGVMVPAAAIPRVVDSLPPLDIKGPPRHEAIKVDAAWLDKHRYDKDLFILDVRLDKQYAEGHIPGARLLCECNFTADYKSPTPYLMKSPEEIAKLLSDKVGLTPDKHVVIYDDGKNRTGVAFLALERIGHQKVSFLEGNYTAWTRAGYPEEKGPSPAVPPSAYQASAKEVLVDSQWLKDNKDQGQVILLDARTGSEYMGHTRRTDVTKKGGHIPGAVSLPLKALLDNEGRLKGADELNWLLSRYGITPGLDKTIITSCNTKSLAAELYLVLRYLGFDKVKVHDGSWAEWSRLY